ncbi:MAG: DUF3987 domain-containing protein [Paludibacteraceae bacterium]|nr:DUF3987 domain-containing protein [Paludibacteraceae bacterium]
MSCYHVFLRDRKKHCEPVHSREEFLALRNRESHLRNLKQVRDGNDNAKHRLLEFNYSCIPTAGILRGCKTFSNSFGIDIDHFDEPEAVVIQRILDHSDDIGLLLLERSCRHGLHLVCRRQSHLSQWDNITRVASRLMLTPDSAAKDLTRVFYATSAEAADLMMRAIPTFDRFPEEEKRRCIESALSQPRTNVSPRLLAILSRLAQEEKKGDENDDFDDFDEEDAAKWHRVWQQMQPHLSPSLSAAVESNAKALRVPVLISLASMVGALSNLRVEVNETMNYINVLYYLVGPAASGKSSLNTLYELVMHELINEESALLQKEDADANLQYQMQNANRLPQRQRYPHRLVASRCSLAVLESLMKHAQGQCLFIFSTEADSQSSSKGSWADLSVPLRCSYHNEPYSSRHASMQSDNLAVKQVRINQVVATTPKGLNRAIHNDVEDGLALRLTIAVAPDNTFAPREQCRPRSPHSKERLRRLGSLLPLTQGDLVLPELQAALDLWLEKIRFECLKSDSRVRAHLRIRCAISAARVVAAWIVVQTLDALDAHFQSQRHAETWMRGATSAEQWLLENPDEFVTFLRSQDHTATIAAYDALADYLLDNLMFFFAKAMQESDEELATHAVKKAGRSNLDYYAALPELFTMKEVFAVRPDVGEQTNRHMVCNWRQQKLITNIRCDGKKYYKKIRK